MSRAATGPTTGPITLLPTLRVGDPTAAYWLRQVTLRLRREVCWLWRERGLLAGGDGPSALLPPFTERLSEVLNLARYEQQKLAFFVDDPTARYLSDALDSPPPGGRCDPPPPQGSFAAVVRELNLAPVECFALALALTAAVDSAAGSVFAACLNDPARLSPTLALAQRLWDEPEAVLPLMDAAHRLNRTGLLSPAPTDWDTPLRTPAIIARQLLFPDAPLPSALCSLSPDPRAILPPGADLLAARLRCRASLRARIVPILGPLGSPLAATAAALASNVGLPTVQPSPGLLAADLPVLFTLAWLRGTALFLPFETLADQAQEGPPSPVALTPPAPLTLFVGLHEPASLKRLPPALTLPVVSLPALTYPQRLQHWEDDLPALTRDPGLHAAAADCARRFRHEADAIRGLCETLRSLGHPPRPADLFAACRTEVDLGELARPVEPRFERSELMLPPRQDRQIAELIVALRSLTTVHFEWNTARAWNECGLSALFAGPPGTGKTMAAEVIAGSVGMPLFKIDLSQVVNKYIGETEKNLRRLFDVAEAADVILFFDEADALFGRRTEVKDAHDRYANLEVSYLLERMERFRGLAILATNRKKDLDEAFLRRLRFLVDFPLPGPEERRRIWQTAIPEGVDASTLDLDFLAQRLPLAGGHIRSILFHACLQTARPGGARALGMPAVVLAARRELDKLGRAISLDQFGPYAAHLDV